MQHDFLAWYASCLLGFSHEACALMDPRALDLTHVVAVVGRIQNLDVYHVQGAPS
jgi:hypothetical protein